MKFLLINNQYAGANTTAFQSHLLTKDLPHLTIQDSEINKLSLNEITQLFIQNQITHSLPFLSFGIGNAKEIYQAFTNLDIKVLNSYQATQLAGSKIQTAYVATANNIAQPNYKVTSNYYQDLEEFTISNPLPVIIKRSHGGLGMWVRELKDKKNFPNLLHSLELQANEEIIFQEKVTSANQSCIRSVVIDNRFIVATTRIPLAGEFRSNVAVNDNQFPLKPNLELIKFSENIAKKFKIGLVGIDIMIDSKGYNLIEINSFPGYTSMLPYTEIDITQVLFDALINQ